MADDETEIQQLAANLTRRATPVVDPVEAGEFAPEAANDDTTYRGFATRGGPQDDGLAVEFSSPE